MFQIVLDPFEREPTSCCGFEDLRMRTLSVSRRGFLAWMQLSHSCRFCVVTIGKFEDCYEGLDCKSLH